MTDSGILGCPYRFLESDELPFIDGNPVYGLQLHHPRFLELVGAPESARLLDHPPLYWVEAMGKERAMVAAATLQRDASKKLQASESHFCGLQDHGATDHRQVYGPSDKPLTVNIMPTWFHERALLCETVTGGT